MLVKVCIPYSHCYNSHLILREREIELFQTTSKTICLLGSTIFYPVTFIIALIANACFAMNYAIHSYKKFLTDRKIVKINNLSDDQIVRLKNQRVRKIEKNLFELQKRHPELNKEYNFQDLFTRYSTLESLVEKEKETNENLNALLIKYLIRVIPFRRYERGLKELEAYVNQSPQQLRELFITRCQFAKIRHELAQCITSHDLHKSLTLLIPVVGLQWTFFSNTTTKDALQKTDLESRYNKGIEQHNWLKPY